MVQKIFLGIYVIVCVFFSIHTSFADENGVVSEENASGSICEGSSFQLTGPTKIVPGYAAEFAVNGEGNFEQKPNITFEISKDGKLIEKKQAEKYVRIFSQPGNIDIKAQVALGECSYTLETKLRVYASLYLSLGNGNESLEENFSDFFEKNNIYFLSLPHAQEKYNFSTSQGASLGLTQYQEYLKQAQKIFIDEAVSINVLDAFVKSQKNYKDIHFSGKDIFILTSQNNSFLSKVLAPYIKQLDIKKIGFIKKESYLDTLNNIIAAIPANIKYASFEKQQSFFSLNMFVRYLTYSGLELSFIALFLAISLAALCVNFVKQFVGINVFGVYYPILLALCLVLLQASFVLVFFMLGFVSLFLLHILSKYSYLLYVPKKTILLSLFSISTLLFLGVDNYFSLGIIDTATFSNTFILFPFLILLLISDKVLHEEVYLLSRRGFFYILELCFVTALCYFVMKSTTVQYVLLTFPDLLFVFLALHILISKYTGLQLLEYVRFQPLLKKLSEEEE